VLRTPNLDQMAEEGLRFNRFYSGAPVCSPTRGSCLTGRHPYRYGIPFANTGRMKAEEITLAEVLRRHGYRTGHFGKWHLGTLTTKIKDSNRGKPGNAQHYAPPWIHGFDVCFSSEAKVPTWDPMKVPRTFSAGSRQMGWPSIEAGQVYQHYGTYYWVGPETRARDNLDGDDSRVIMDRAVPFIEKAAADQQPFFAVIWFHTPHLPVVAGPRHAAMYREHSLHARNYYGCITAMDEQMGRLRQCLARAGVDEQTMIWFCSDNGPEGKDRDPGTTRGLRGRKRSLYEGGVRVPGLLVWPERIRAGRVVDIPCSTSDYFPTILDCLGYTLPASEARPYDGVSLMPLIAQDMRERPRRIGFESRNQVSLVGNRYKLIGKAGGPYELYDLLEDPGEQQDLARTHPAVVQQEREILERWRASCGRSAAGEDY
jgi:arylsulfatase A-like enzyme